MYVVRPYPIEEVNLDRICKRFSSIEFEASSPKLKSQQHLQKVHTTEIPNPCPQPRLGCEERGDEALIDLIPRWELLYTPFSAGKLVLTKVIDDPDIRTF